MEPSSAEAFILIIEENQEQVVLIQTALQSDSVLCRVEAISDDTEALNFLHRRGKYAQAERPNLVLLSLPTEKSRRVLEELSSSSQLRRIPIVLLNESEIEEDIFNSYALQGNGYVIKPQNQEQLHQGVQRVKDFWLGIVTLPIE
ncbi:response regulator [Leptolyngbya sp. AN03gr2]|uniref:response regulator n=1 Tax=unclassified Leptolyngbya TaxID=2650499 RepID=UPI003D319014